VSPETSAAGGPRGFSPTLWTVVLRARDRSREALSELIVLYWRPIYFFIRRWGYGVEDAKDLCQDFFAELLDRDVLKGVAPDKGRFRTFLLTVLKRFLINRSEKARALKRGGGRAALSIDFSQAEEVYATLPSTRETPERAFARQWAVDTLQRALEALGREMDPAQFEALKPHLAGEGPAYARTAEAMGMSVTQLNNVLHRARRRYRELLRLEVAAGVDDPADVDDELRGLFEALKG
jgi:RNA polymerase sigma-70 factor (ECF subfamily)